jgi:hypothetical protein
MQGKIHNIERGTKIRKHGTVQTFENSSNISKNKVGVGGTKERLNDGILATLLNWNFVFHLHNVFREHKTRRFYFSFTSFVWE